MTDDLGQRTVPASALRELVARWRDEATEINRSRQAHPLYANGKADATRERANELEALIEE